MNIRLLILPLTLVALLAGCTSPVSIDSDYDSDINIADFKTYSWRAPY